MAILKCKMCGGDIQATDGAAYGTCESCGTTSTLPKASDERKANLFNRANHLRRQNEFDKAAQAYENILNDDNDDAEAHWGVVLSRYGIEYVEDPTTHQRVPTCHRVQSESILKDADYLETLKHAPDEYTKSLYEEEAKKISEIQKDILAISKKEQPYDVFICYKEATDGGSRTKDSVIAQDVYDQFTKEGYRVFFARISLEDKLGQQYEPYIFSALNSAKVMLVVGTKKEHFEAVWVRNEWSRFLALKKKDPSRMIIPCYRDMDPYDLPDELASLGLQAQDMGKIGFLQDLSRNMKKILEEEKNTKKKQAVPAVIPKMFADVTLEKEKANLSKQINDAEKFNIVLEDSVAAARDNLSRLQDQLRDYQQRERDDLARQERERRETEYIASLNRGGYQGLQDQANSLVSKMYAGISSWTDGVRDVQKLISDKQNTISYGQGRIAETRSNLVTYNSQLRELEAKLRKTPEQRAEDHYQLLLDEKSTTTNEKGFTELAKKFREMEGYKDTETIATECENLVFKVQYDRLVQAKNKASTADEYQDLARKFRELNGYDNTAELASECDNSAVKARYNQLVQAKNKASTADEYQELARKFREMNGYENTATLAKECDNSALKTRYNQLVKAKNRASTEGEYKKLVSQFRAMNNYENTNELANECDNQYQMLKNRRKEEEARLAEEKAEKEASEKARLEKEEAEKKIKKTTKAVLHLCITAAYLFVLWGTYIIRVPWEDDAINFLSYLIRCFPLMIFSLAIGIVGKTFSVKGAGDTAGFFLLLLMVLLQSITICVWREDVGILFFYLIGRVVVNALSIIPGFVFWVSTY